MTGFMILVCNIVAVFGILAFVLALLQVGVMAEQIATFQGRNDPHSSIINHQSSIPESPTECSQADVADPSALPQGAEHLAGPSSAANVETVDILVREHRGAFTAHIVGGVSATATLSSRQAARAAANAYLRAAMAARGWYVRTLARQPDFAIPHVGERYRAELVRRADV